MSKTSSSRAALTIDIITNTVSKASRDLVEFAKASAIAARESASLKDSVARVPGYAKTAAIGIAAMAAGLGALSAASLTQERAERRLQGALERSGRSYGDASRLITEYAASQQAATRVGDDATLASLARLADLTATIEASTEQLIGWQRLAADVAEATGKSLEESTMLVAKAAGGNAEVIAELIPGMRSQAQAAAAMVDPNERAAFALDALSESFGGAARNIGETDLAIARIRNGFGDLIESAGRLVNNNAGVQSGLIGIANATDAAAAAFAEGTPAGQLFGDTVGLFARYAAENLQALASYAIRAGHAIGEVSAAIGGAGADRINDRIAAAAEAMQTFEAATNLSAVAAGGHVVTTRELSRVMGRLVEQRLLEADTAEEIARNYAAGGAQTAAARREIELVTRSLAEQTHVMREQVGAESEAFATRRANMLALAELAQRPTPPEAADAPAVTAGRVRTVERTAAAAADAERNAAQQERQFRIETNNAMSALFDAHAETMRAKKEAVSAQTIEAQQALDAKLIVLEDERQRRLQIAAEKEAATLAQRQQIGVSAANKLTSAIIAIEGKSARERRAALRRMAGDELVTEGAKLVAKGTGNLIALNPIGGLQVAGGLSMIVAGAKFGASGGGSGSGASSGRSAAQVERMPERSSGPTESNTTVIVNMGASLPRRAVEDAQRSSVVFSGAA